MRKILFTIAVVFLLGGVYLYLLVPYPALNPFEFAAFLQNHVRALKLYVVNTVISDYVEETRRMPEDLTQAFGLLETRDPNDGRLSLKEWAKGNAKYKTNATRDKYFLLLIGDRPGVRENVALYWNGYFFHSFEAFAWHEFQRFGEDEAGSVGPGEASGPAARREGGERRGSPEPSANGSLNGG